MADDSGVDPRYAAQFQRGYDPARDRPPARPGPKRLEGGPPPAAPRVPDPPRMAPPVTEDPGATSTPTDDEPVAPISSGWWEWLLPIVGAGLIAIAAMLWWSIGTDTATYFGTGGPSDEWTLFWQHLRYTLPGPLMIAGAVAITGGLVLQAVGPRR